MGAIAGIAGRLALGAGEDLLGGLGKDLLTQTGEGMAKQLGGDVINSLFQGGGNNNANGAGASQGGVENTDWGSDV